MECPNCNETMKKGEVMSQTGVRIYWQPEEACQELNKMRLTKRGVENKGGVVLINSQSNIHGKLLAHICEKCKIVLMNY